MTPRARLVLAGAVAICIIGLVLLLRPRTGTLPPATNAPVPAAAPFQPSSPGRPALARIPPGELPSQPRSPLADDLNSTRHAPRHDLEIVLSLLRRYRASFREFPGGENNAQFVNALTGNNPARLAILPPDHPAISADGELTDRWGTPFFFHLVGADAMEIRSAGPDRTRGTADDLQIASRPGEPPR
jgi:hypothetical protein